MIPSSQSVAAGEHLVSSGEIERLFQRVVLANDRPDYLERYDGFDFGAVFDEAQLRTMDFPRLVTILEFARLVEKHRISPQHALSINGGPGGDPELKHLVYDSLDVADYEDDPKRHDLHDLKLEREKYDFAIVSQTFEHLYDPARAARNVYDLLRSGGWLWISLPTVSHQHQLPYHFVTGLTPIGVATVMRQAGFEVVEVGQWGNAKYIAYLFSLGVIPTYYDLARINHRAGIRRMLRLARRLSPADFLADGRRNDFACPAQTWVLARKPVAG